MVTWFIWMFVINLQSLINFLLFFTFQLKLQCQVWIVVYPLICVFFVSMFLGFQKDWIFSTFRLVSWFILMFSIILQFLTILLFSIFELKLQCQVIIIVCTFMYEILCVLVKAWMLMRFYCGIAEREKSATKEAMSIFQKVFILSLIFFF